MEIIAEASLLKNFKDSRTLAEFFNKVKNKKEDVEDLDNTTLSDEVSSDLPFAKSYIEELRNKMPTNLSDYEGLTNLDFIGRTNLNDYDPKRSLFRKGLDFLKENPAAIGIGAASLAGGLMTPKQEEDELATTISKETGIPIAQIRKEVQDATAQGQDALDALKSKYPFLVRADSALKDGGKAKKKTYRYKDKPYGPKFAAEGGIMNLDGMEMDLRGGGFVPIGKAEKADDVPARLSKNEFVFTADAVRAAGGGSVDKGADLMYKTMKQLEDRVA